MQLYTLRGSEGLKGKLMKPQLVDEFIRAFHEEINRQNSAREMDPVTPDLVSA